MTDDSAEQGELWLSHEQLREWKSLMALLMTMPARLDAQLKQDAGLNLFEYHILVELADAPERLQVMSDLAILARGSLSRLSHVVSRLEKRGWVRRAACPGDGRFVNAVLTDEGMAKVVATAPGHVEAVRRFVVDALSPQHLAELGCASGAILTVIPKD